MSSHRLTPYYKFECALWVAGVAQQVDNNKRAMTLASAVLLITVPWMQISRVAASGVSVSPRALVAVVAAGAALHLAFLALNSAVCRGLQLGGGSNPDNYVQEGVGGLSKKQQREQGVTPHHVPAQHWPLVFMQGP